MSGKSPLRSTSPDSYGIGRVVIVGAGRAGLTLGTALARSKVGSVTLICRSEERRRRVEHWIARCQASDTVLAAEFGSWRVSPAVVAGCRSADTVVFATADRDLTAAAEAWHKAGAARSGQVWLHLSGVSEPSCLAVPGGVEDVGSVHPLAAIPDPLTRADGPLGMPPIEQAIAPLQGAFFALAGNEVALGRAEALARRIGGRPSRVALVGRAAYHAAAAVVANDMVGLLAVGEALASAAGLTAVEARRALLHLAGTSLDALSATAMAPGASLARGLTGAVGRGDAATLAAHLDALSADHDGWVAHVALSRILLGLVQDAGLLDEEAAARVLEVLSHRRRRRTRPVD